MIKRTLISSNSKWEPIVGYSRAVRTGDRVLVSGTTAVDDHGEIVGKNDVYTQTKFIILKIEKALNEAGAGLSNVVRNRIYVTDISQWEDVARAHHEFFSEIRPCSTMVEISSLVDPEMLVEIETEAVIE